MKSWISLVLSLLFSVAIIPYGFAINELQLSENNGSHFYIDLHSKSKSTSDSYNILIQNKNRKTPTNATVSKAQYYNVSKENLAELRTQKPDFFTQEIKIDNKSVKLILEKVNVTSPDFHITTSDGRVLYPDMSELLHYRGVIANESTSWVTLSITKDKIKYLITSPEGNYEINQVEENMYAGYYSKDQKSIPYYDDKTVDDVRNSVHQNAQNAGSRVGSCLEIYFECDNKTYGTLGDINSVTNWVTSLTNDVAAIYALHNVPLYMSELFIWTTDDPYTNLTNIGAIRDEFVQTLQNNYDGRIAHLLSVRALGGGIANGIGGYCNTYPTYPGPQCFSSQLSSSITPYPNYSFNSYVIAHEMGHVMGLRHTHACVWNNTLTQIDDCGNMYAFDNGDTPEGLSCYDSDNDIIPAGGGTIMSNCNLINGVGINLSAGFGLLPGQMLYENFVYADCTTGISCGSLPPVNDLCANAINLTVRYSCESNSFNNIRATATAGVPPFTCGSPGNPIKDVWFKLVVPPSGSVSIETGQVTSGLTDMLIQAYSGSCGSLTSIACDDNTGTGNHSLLTLSGRTPGETIYVRVVDSGSNDEGIFDICAYDSNLPCHPDYTALVSFYNATAGSSWSNKSGWQQGAAGSNCNVCTWYGITCNSAGRVTDIRLSSNNITGNSIPSTLTQISFLNHLVLYNNNLSGNIPNFLNNFPVLVTLDLGGNDFTGAIPASLGSINNLRSLYLDGNQLSGSLPSSLTNIDLSLIYVQNNALTGCFPSGYSIFCDKAYNFSGNPLLANGITFATYCATGNGGDEDSDGYCQSLGDCNDDDNTMFPGNPEVCDLKDNNCNGLIDDIASPQTNTWIAGSGSWFVATNWSLGVVPQRCQNVVIAGSNGTVVTIPSAQIGEARSVLVQSGKSLIIQNTGSLTINNGLNLINSGTVTNNGTLSINNILDNALFGITNSGTITNSSSGSITIQNSGIRSLSNNTGGILTNTGSLTIDGNSIGAVSTGIYNAGNTMNSGQVTVRNITGNEVIIAPGSTFNNQVNGVLNLE